MHCWCFRMTSNHHISSSNTFCHVILLFIVGAVLKGTQTIFLLWKMLMRHIIAWWRWAKKTMEVYARWESIGVICSSIFSPINFWGPKFKNVWRSYAHIYIYMYATLCWLFYISIHKNISVDKTCLSVHPHKCVCIFCMYVPLPACLLGRGAVELVPRSYMLTNILGKFYDCFPKWRLKRRQKNWSETKFSAVSLVLYYLIA